MLFTFYVEISRIKSEIKGLDNHRKDIAGLLLEFLQVELSILRLTQSAVGDPLLKF